MDLLEDFRISPLTLIWVGFLGILFEGWVGEG